MKTKYIFIMNHSITLHNILRPRSGSGTHYFCPPPTGLKSFMRLLIIVRKTVKCSLWVRGSSIKRKKCLMHGKRWVGESVNLITSKDF